MTVGTMKPYIWCPICKQLTAYFGMEFSSQRVVCFACDFVLSEAPAKVISSKEEAAFLKNAADKLMAQMEEERQL